MDKDTLRIARRAPNGRLAIVERPDTDLTAKPRLNRQDQLAQATAMYQRRLFGDGTIAQLAEDFNLDPATVRKRLDLARADGIPAAAREAFIQDMLPAAMAVVLEAMRQTDDMKLALAAAVKVIDGLEAMKAPTTNAPAGSGDEESLEVYRERIKIVRRDHPPIESHSGAIRGANQLASGGDLPTDATIIETLSAGPATPDAPTGGGSPEELPLRRADGWGSDPGPAAD